MPDSSTTVSELREIVREFIRERDWERYHTPKNLSIALGVEVAELQEHFQWWTDPEITQKLTEPAERRQVGEEIADVCAYLLSLVNTLGFDLSTLLEEKMEKNRIKYPADEHRGDYRKP